jgi:hypothetical protein
MIHKRVLLTLSIFLGLVTHATAGESYYQKLFGGKACWPDCVGKYTCDDYVPKCLPCAKPIGCFTGDDYCRKCLPLPRPAQCFSCDDYCRKPFQFYCQPLPHLKDSPTEQATKP